MKLESDQLIQIAYKYFTQKEISSFSEEYYLLEETKLLVKLAAIQKQENDSWNKFLISLKKKITQYKVLDVSYNYEGVLSRSYGIVVNLVDSKYYQKILDVNVSYLIPYYTIAILEFDKLDYTAWKHPPTIAYSTDDLDITRLIKLIKIEIENSFGYQEFPIKLLNKVIPNISFGVLNKGEFTNLHAFFIDAYKIRF